MLFGLRRATRRRRVATTGGECGQLDHPTDYFEWMPGPQSDSSRLRDSGPHATGPRSKGERGRRGTRGGTGLVPRRTRSSSGPGPVEDPVQLWNRSRHAVEPTCSSGDPYPAATLNAGRAEATPSVGEEGPVEGLVWSRGGRGPAQDPVQWRTRSSCGTGPGTRWNRPAPAETHIPPRR